VVDQTKDRCFAGAVAPDEPDMLTGIDLKGCAAQNILRAIRFVHV
jgi:hypothetical protein